MGSEEEKKHQEEELKVREEKYSPSLQVCQKKLDQYVKQIRLSTRLVDSPTCLVTEEHEYCPRLDRLLQKGKSGGPKQRRIMELNADHPVIGQLYDRFQANPQDSQVSDSMEVLFELALLAEGSEFADPVRLSQLAVAVLQKAL